MDRTFPLFLTIPKAAKLLGVPEDALWRDIRRGTCPFEVKKIGGRLHLSTRSLGLAPEPQNSEGQNQDQNLAVAA
jgi:hypothetical protein